MRSIGVKTAATCDTIGGRSDKESDPPPGGKRVASLLAPRPSNSEHTWESAGPSPLEKLEARGILRMPSMHGGPAGPGIRPQLRDLRPRGPRPLALPRWSRPPPGLGYWFLALGRRGRAALPRGKLLRDSARGAQRLRASSGISDLRSSPRVRVRPRQGLRWRRGIAEGVGLRLTWLTARRSSARSRWRFPVACLQVVPRTPHKYIRSINNINIPAKQITERSRIPELFSQMRPVCRTGLPRASARRIPGRFWGIPLGGINRSDCRTRRDDTKGIDWTARRHG